MNTRGLTELIVLSIGKELGVLDGEMFSMMVLMALITTAMTGPLMDIIYPAEGILYDAKPSSRELPKSRLLSPRRLWSGLGRKQKKPGAGESNRSSKRRIILPILNRLSSSRALRNEAR
jgi:hypothetical protein